MSIDNNDASDEEDEDDDSDNMTDGDGGNLGGLEDADEERDIDHSLETVFRSASHPASTTVDLDTESETSDEEEPQPQPVPRLLDSENVECSGPRSAQTGRYSHSIVNFLRNTNCYPY